MDVECYNKKKPKLRKIQTHLGCAGKGWLIDADVEKNRIVLRYFKLMKNQLRFSICDLDMSSEFNNDIPNLDTRVKEKIQSNLQYANSY